MTKCTTVPSFILIFSPKVLHVGGVQNHVSQVLQGQDPLLASRTLAGRVAREEQGSNDEKFSPNFSPNLNAGIQLDLLSFLKSMILIGLLHLNPRVF